MGRPTKESSINKLLEESPESYYWLGFLMADGCFRKRSKFYDLSVYVSEKESEHIQKLCSFIDVPLVHRIKKDGYGFCGFCKQDKDFIHRIMDKIKCKQLKTYNPPEDLFIGNDDLFISLLIGFIDGDGQIDKKGCIKIELHSSWEKILNEWWERIFRLSGIKNVHKNLRIPKAKINSRGYVRVFTANGDVSKLLNSKIQEYKLPVIKRKWERLKLNKKSYNDINKENIMIIEMYKNKMKVKEIAEKTNKGESAIRHIIRTIE